MSSYTDYMVIYTYFSYVCNRLQLIKRCLCCFVGMHLFSNILSTIATISSSINLELIPACFPCINKQILSQSSLVPDVENTVFESPEAETIILGGLLGLLLIQIL